MRLWKGFPRYFVKKCTLKKIYCEYCMCVFRFLKQLSLQSEQSQWATISRKLPGTSKSSHPPILCPHLSNQILSNTPITGSHQELALPSPPIHLSCLSQQSQIVLHNNGFFLHNLGWVGSRRATIHLYNATGKDDLINTFWLKRFFPTCPAAACSLLTKRPLFKGCSLGEFDLSQLQT